MRRGYVESPQTLSLLRIARTCRNVRRPAGKHWNVARTRHLLDSLTTSVRLFGVSSDAVAIGGVFVYACCPLWPRCIVFCKNGVIFAVDGFRLRSAVEMSAVSACHRVTMAVGSVPT